VVCPCSKGHRDRPGADADGDAVRVAGPALGIGRKRDGASTRFLRADEPMMRGGVARGGPLEPLPGFICLPALPRVGLRPTRGYWLKPLPGFSNMPSVRGDQGFFDQPGFLRSDRGSIAPYGGSSLLSDSQKPNRAPGGVVQRPENAGCEDPLQTQAPSLKKKARRGEPGRAFEMLWLCGRNSVARAALELELGH
jgi:hypothetical protein